MRVCVDRGASAVDRRKGLSRLSFVEGGGGGVFDKPQVVRILPQETEKALQPGHLKRLRHAHLARRTADRLPLEAL